MSHDLDSLLGVSSDPGNPAAVAAVIGASGDQTHFARDAAARYRDAYLIARVTTGFGTVIKGIGGVLAGTIFFGALSMSNQPYINEQTKTTYIVAGLVMATGCAAVFYLFGVLVAAQGQILKATLDGAVHTSPFLSDPQKAQVMSLR